MPIYKSGDMELTPDVKNPAVKMVQIGGELIKAGIVSYGAEEGPPPHYHPNDEQFVYVLGGSAAQLLGEEITVVEAGDMIHIPRNTVHGIRVLDSPFRFFTCKSPSGSGKLSEDYTEVPNAADLQRQLREVA